MATKRKSAKRPSRSGQLRARGKPKAKFTASRNASQVALQRALRDSIEREIAGRIAAHRRDVSRIQKAVARGEQPPLMLLAHGDSWFNYPLNGNGLPWGDTDIIANLENMGAPRPQILNISHFGDATTDEMGLRKQQRLIDALSNPKNWLSGKPDAILFSGGGNDIAGDQFCIYLNYKDSHTPGLDADRFAGRLASIRASYNDLFLFRDRHAPHVPIFGHGYDFPHPMTPHPPCTGPWISPSLKFTGWTDDDGTQILHAALDRFQKTLVELASSEFIVVATQGTLAKEDWANELHPYPPGFKKLAARFLTELQNRFRGRI
jgi:hypothetical protein